MAEFARVVHQLAALIEEETAALGRGERARLAEFNYRKGHGFLEFTRAAAALKPAGAADPRLEGMVAGLRTALEANKRVLKLHLDAAQEVAGVVASAIRRAESDGTYAPAHWSAGR